MLAPRVFPVDVGAGLARSLSRVQLSREAIAIAALVALVVLVACFVDRCKRDRNTRQ